MAARCRTSEQHTAGVKKAKTNNLPPFPHFEILPGVCGKFPRTGLKLNRISPVVETFRSLRQTNSARQRTFAGGTERWMGRTKRWRSRSRGVSGQASLL